MAAILLCLHYPRLDSRLAPSLVAMVIGDFHMLNPWLAITFQAMRLGFEAQNAVTLRVMRLVGAANKTEARSMIAQGHHQRP